MIYTHVCVSLTMFLCMHACMHACMYIYRYTYIHRHSSMHHMCVQTQSDAPTHPQVILNGGAGQGQARHAPGEIPAYLNRHKQRLALVEAQKKVRMYSHTHTHTHTLSVYACCGMYVRMCVCVCVCEYLRVYTYTLIRIYAHMQAANAALEPIAEEQRLEVLNNLQSRHREVIRLACAMCVSLWCDVCVCRV